MKNHISWSISLWWFVLSVSKILWWSEELWWGWSSFWMHHQVILHRYYYYITYELCSVLAFETMDDPHIRWLQMACAIWLKNITSIFFRAVVSLRYAAHWSIKRKIFLFFAPIWQSSCTRNSSKVAKVIHELESGVYLVGSFLLFWSSQVCCTCQSPLVVISLCHQHWILAEQWFCSTMARITLVCQCLTGLEIIEESGFINIKNMSFSWYPSTILDSSSVFPVYHCFRIYSGTFSQHSLVYQVLSFIYNDQSSHLKPQNRLYLDE